MSFKPPARRRPRSGAPLVISAFNRCNAFNILLSLAITFLVWRFWQPLTTWPHATETSSFDPAEKLDPALIDELIWTASNQKQQEELCRLVGSYGHGGANDSRALILRLGAQAWRPTGHVTLNSLVRRYPMLMGTVTISPTPVFTLFTNSTQQQYADAHLTADQVPAKLEPMTLSRFKALLRPGRRRATPKLYYDREFYYWSGQPPSGLGHRPNQPPLNCLLQPSVAAHKDLVLTTPRLRVTAKDSVHIMHHDTSPSLLVQLQGRKLVTLVPPEQLDWTYPYPRDHLMYRRSRIDLLKPDYEKYPLSRNLQLTEVIMREGDVLVFPMSTPHQTRTLTDNVNMSFRFKKQVAWRRRRHFH